MNSANLVMMLGIQLRTGWKTLLGWLLSTIALMGVTSAALVDTYNTPDKIANYATSVGSGAAIEMINGRIAGLDSIGGVLANEYGFIASFVLPIMGIAVVSRSTRREEEAGRLELLLASAIGRGAPLVAALLVAAATAVLMGVGCWLLLLASGFDGAGSAWYSAGLAALVMVFGAVTAVAAQIVESNRGVMMIGLAVALVSYLVRGLGAVNDGWYFWLTPHGWFDGIAAFGRARLWPLLVSLAAAVVLTMAALALNTRRDLGAALVRARSGAPRASATLRSRWGLALHEHLGTLIGWVVASVAVLAIFGSLAQQVIEVLESTPELQVYVDGALESVMSFYLLMASMLAAAAGIVMGGTLRGVETSGRLEAVLAGPRGRIGWIVRHLVVVSMGALVVLWAGALSLAASAAASLGDDRLWASLMWATAAQMPVVLAFSGASVLLFAALPRLRGWLWAVFGVAAFIASMTNALGLPEWFSDNTPFLVVGAVPAVEVRWVGVAVLSGIVVATHVLAPVFFRHRNLPTV